MNKNTLRRIFYLTLWLMNGWELVTDFVECSSSSVRVPIASHVLVGRKGNCFLTPPNNCGPIDGNQPNGWERAGGKRQLK